MSRLHTSLTVALVSLVILAPVGLWLYAKAASADRGTEVAANELVLRSLPHPHGVKRVAEYSYALARWGNDGGLVPTSGYRTELFLQLPHETAATAVVDHYRHAVGAWHRRGVTIEVAVVGRRVRTYALYVSQ